MTINTKYNAGQKVYFFREGKIIGAKIHSIDITVTDRRYTSCFGFKKEGTIETNIKYYIFRYGYFLGTDLFETKEDLINAVNGIKNNKR